jgi:hypothetical protein
VVLSADGLRDPDFRTERNATFLGKMQKDVQEVLGNYGRIDLLWFDWDGREPLYDQTDTYALVRKMQPDIVINNRLDLGVGNDNTEIRSPNADYYTPEQQIGKYDDQRPWETCMTLGTQWSWKPNDKDQVHEGSHPHSARVVGGDGICCSTWGRCPMDGSSRARSKCSGKSGLDAGKRRKHLRHTRRTVQTYLRPDQHAQGERRLRPYSEAGWRADHPAAPSKEDHPKPVAHGGRCACSADRFRHHPESPAAEFRERRYSR